MKKLLLATTILGMSAGFAAAESHAAATGIAFTGTAKVGFAQNGTAEDGETSVDAKDKSNKYLDDQINLYNSFELSIAATGATDSGLTFGASTAISSGVAYDFGYDEDGFDLNGQTLDAPKVYIAGDFGKLSVKVDEWSEYQGDNNDAYDVQYEHTIAGFSIGLRTDVESDNALTEGKSSVKLGYTVGGVALTANYDQVDDAWGVSAAYTMGALTFTVQTEDSDVADSEASYLKVAYKGDAGFSGDIKANSDDEVEVNVSYTAGALTLGVGAESTPDQDRWSVTGSYDLGGGLSAVAGVNHAEDMYLGAEMKF